MPHTITYNSIEKIIEIQVQGDFSLNEAKEIIANVTLVAKEHNCFLVLSDFREATLKLSISEIHEMPKIISEIVASSGLHVHKTKRAIVVGSQDVEKYRFFDNIIFNRGQFEKLFYDIDKAKKWLFGK